MRMEVPHTSDTLRISAATKDAMSPSEELRTPSLAAEPTMLGSPAPPDTSLTPPPSTQQPPTNRTIARTPTPQTSHLSSPPPTKLVEPAYSEHEEQIAELPSKEWVANASVEELRDRVSELAATLRQARAETASHKMQYNMLRMESTEQHQRMVVELDMVQREVEVLQMAESRRQAAEAMTKSSIMDPNAANATLLHEMSRHCAALQRENEDYQDVNAQLHRTLEYREDQVARLTDDNDRLRTRIRKNREHTNSYLEHIHGNSPPSLYSTPHQPTPRSRAPMRTGPLLSAQSTGLAPFEALLAADKVLSQETNTAPGTPLRSHGGKRSFGHRAAHSLSSLPSTPQRSREPPNPSMLQTPVHFTPVAPVAPMTGPAGSASRRHVRARSSDSTITASSVEADHARGHDSDDNDDDDDDVPESQASQAATSMLRRTPASSKSFQGSQKSSFGNSGGLRQTKLFGQILKPGLGAPVEKRVLSDAGNQGVAKRAKLSEGVGLGIH